jgi:His/Glu/Gln/Arg/opine family amino acid ABC transporter permease subunit
MTLSLASIPGFLLPGVGLTAEVTGAAFGIVVVIAVLLALGRESQFRAVRWFCRAYVDLFRSVPLLAMILLVFFGLPTLTSTLRFSGFWSAVIAISITEGAYAAEVYRAALGSVGRAQRDAAASIGLTRTQSYVRVILPQAVVPAIAPTVNTVIWVIKDTTLASLIAVNELTLRASSLININAEPLATYAWLLLFYVAVTIPLGYLGRFAEQVVGARLDAGSRLA